ncbi:hypothetical protein K1T71_001972 [Dendrolimus kikuchii]|uniref:Uncharacterized protein n=1 Tax=Dendrolimus kikuchii TaxID=765133 RepID=A0ACC1DF75_9NEOP|nr:hypothetical protein K1T71_001972 [Dendrolimus kikuchii]
MCRKNGDKNKQLQPARYRKQNYIEDSDSSDEHQSENIIFNLSTYSQKGKPYLVSAIVNDKKITLELDTGSKLSVISWKFYKEHFKNVSLLPNNLSLYSYVGTVIEPVGYIYVNVVIGKHKAQNLKLFVIKKGGPPLLGRSWLKKLKINNINVNNLLYNIRDLDNFVENLKNEFPTVFSPGLGTCTKKISLKLIDSNPVFIKARPLPLALREPVALELKRLEAEGTIRKVDYSDYGSPIVPVIKKNGDIRICGDYKVTINPKLMREPYPLPRIEELFAALSGGEQFSKIDLTNAYQQLWLEEDSQPCTAITTHVGTYVYRRTPFGLTCIPEKFQKFMEETLKGLKGVAVFMDDIAVSGPDKFTHLSNLKALFARLSEVGLRIKLEKCKFMQDSISYLGFIIDKNGLHPDPNKVKAIVEAPAPSDITQLRSFLGFINYYAKFIPNLSTLLHPLHKLLKKNKIWVWSQECDKAFQSVKNSIANTNVLVHYKPDLPLVLAVDSSSYGIGSVLSHRYPNGEDRPICFASRTLNTAERAYSQIDKEALAIIKGVMKHHQYLYGRHFIIKTDHKPLTFIFGPKFGLPQVASSRLQRYATRLAAYDFDVEFVKSNSNGNADALSRLPLPYEPKNESGLNLVSYINYVEDSFPISAREVALKTQTDEVLSKIYKYIMNGWPTLVNDNEKPYYNRKEYLSIEQGCILYNHRVIIPVLLRKQVLRELHEGHLGVVKMKNLSRNYVYWPNLDNEIEVLCRDCTACRQQRDAPPQSLLHPWVFPARPWQRLHIDFAEFQGKHYLVTVDAHSKWIEVQKMTNTTASTTINKLRELFARFGLPSQVVSDGGPPFGSREFGDYMNKNLITHTITSPYRPAGNGAAENAVKSVKRAMKKSVHEGVDLETAIAQFLFQYRNCDHVTTGVAPAVAILGRRLRGRLDILKPSTERNVEKICERVGRARPGAERYVNVGDPVLARDYRARTDKWAPANVVAREAPLSYRVRLSDGHEWKRHIDQIIPNKTTRLSVSHSLINNEADNSDKSKTIEAPSHIIPDSADEVIEHDIDRANSPKSTSNDKNVIEDELLPKRLRRKCIYRGKYVY